MATYKSPEDFSSGHFYLMASHWTVPHLTITFVELGIKINLNLK